MTAAAGLRRQTGAQWGAGRPGTDARRPQQPWPWGVARRLLAHDVRVTPSGPADGPTEREPFGAHHSRSGAWILTDADLLAAVEQVGLTGQGGAHAPTARRWQRALATGGASVVVGNGAESEPLAAKDGTLLRQRPHLVLDGLVATARALRAPRAVVWLHGDDGGARSALEAALAERPADAGVRVEVVAGPVHYLAGESTAVANAVAGGPALPTTRRPPAHGGPPGRRPFVQNVETLARVGLLAHGQLPPSTRLLSVATPAARWVLEVPVVATFGQVMAQVGVPEPAAVLLGGFGGAWASWPHLRDLPVDEARLRTTGLSLGAGVVAPLSGGTCGVRQTAVILEYLAAMSARQCGPCVFGLPALAREVARLADGRGSRSSADRLTALGRLVDGRGACHHPDGAARLAASAVRTFADDLAAHVAGRPCAAARSVVVPGLAP